MLFSMVLQIVTYIDTRLKTIETGIETTNEIKIKQFVNFFKVRNWETAIAETKTAQSVLENSCQAISEMFAGLEKIVKHAKKITVLTK